ncbi:MAG: thiamine pyrophosphate-dependent enzyme [Candidatus Pacebacteria bacterium]|nr:thiamine pyrophosphate-dependent enzyme [Candidatus Paceibacterota bacterium]
MDELLVNDPGKKVILMGNDAIVRGALESGVQFVATYPGTPASEIGNDFYRISKEANVIFEFSTNEKVAMEVAAGSSFSGLKTLVAMKNFGLNVASDPLLPFIYTGSKGPTVIFIADDPSCHSSAQSEENTRAFSYLGHIPTLEPADAKECKEFTKIAFDLSEKFQIPVMVRTTTRVAHQKMPMVLGEYKKNSSLARGEFVKDANRFVTLPPRVLGMKTELIEKIKKMQLAFEKSNLNFIDRGSSKATEKRGIIASGVAYLYVKEALKELGLDLPILKVGTFYPLPEKKIQSFIKGLKNILVAEELEPYLEKEVARLAKDANCKLEIHGKDLLPEVGELRPEYVTLALAKFLGKKYVLPRIKTKLAVPKRFPQLCPGCPYWLVFGGVKKATEGKNVIYGGDIGCYMLAGMPPHFLQDYLSCMGSSIGIGHGIKRATGQKLVSFIGDGTFFHAGIPALINTVYNQSNPLIIILENEITAMTGHQPHPGALGAKVEIKIEDVVTACGVKNLKIIDPVQQQEFIAAIDEFLEKPEVSVIIARHPCKFVKKV